MFVEVAEGLGIRSVLHTDYRSTCAKLAAFGLDPGVEKSLDAERTSARATKSSELKG